MASINRRVDKNRATLMKMVNLVDALNWITLSATKESIDWSAHIKKNIPLLTKKELRDSLQRTADLMHSIKTITGAKISDKNCLEMYNSSISCSPDPNRVSFIQLTWFKENFLVTAAQEPLNLWPKHSLIELHHKARDTDKGNQVSFVVPETVLYENMAVLYNKARGLEKLGYDENKPFVTKDLRACMSSCVLMALNFVESYLNGLGLCIILDESKRGMLTSDDIALLLEKNADDATRTKFYPFEKKILTYPRLFLNADFPPIQKSNCPEFNTIIEKGKKYRDSLAHPSFVPNIKRDHVSDKIKLDFITPKVEAIIDLKFTDVTEIVDAAVGLVKRIDKLTYGWTDTFILKRDKDGKFPDESFR